jgi:hypothetical protein
MSDHPVFKKLKPPVALHKPSGDLSAKPLVGLFVSAFLLAFCLALLFLAMRGVLALGGMVASGGPYAIEHPAPVWVWLFPVSIFLGLISVFAHQMFHHDAGGPSLLFLAWPALFLSLGYNFLEFSFRQPGGGHQIVWAWLVCGLLFVIMGGGPLLMTLTKRSRNADRGSLPPQKAPQGRDVFLILLNLAAVGFGLWGAVSYFRFLSR